MRFEDTILAELQHHPRVCANCYRLRHDEDPIPERIERLSSRTLWADAVLPPRTQTEDMDSAAPPGDTVSESTPRTVCECGEFDPRYAARHDSPDSLSRAELIELGQHLSETLDRLEKEAAEHGAPTVADEFSHNTDALFDAIRHLKTSVENVSDERILAVAVEVACNRATHEAKAESIPDENGPTDDRGSVPPE